MSWHDHLIAVLDPTGTLPIGVYADDQGRPDYESLIWESDTVPKPTREEFAAAVARAEALEYRTARRAAYPPIVDQLDMIFHDIDRWRAVIQEVKEAFPKPSLDTDTE